jgi:hypothetical protein
VAVVSVFKRHWSKPAPFPSLISPTAAFAKEALLAKSLNSISRRSHEQHARPEFSTW